MRPCRSAAALPVSTPRSRNTMPTPAAPIPMAIPRIPSVAFTSCRRLRSGNASPWRVGTLRRGSPPLALRLVRRRRHPRPRRSYAVRLRRLVGVHPGGRVLRAVFDEDAVRVEGEPARPVALTHDRGPRLEQLGRVSLVDHLHGVLAVGDL